jgi:hypothetical protein
MTMSHSDSASIALRGLAVLALVAGAVGTWRRGGTSAGERRALAVLAAVVLLVVAGVVAWVAVSGR